MKEWQKSLIIILAIPFMLFGGLLLYGAYSSKEVSAQTSCSGKHNIVVDRGDFLAIMYPSDITTYLFTLPEEDFNELYQKFQVKSAAALVNCTDNGNNPKCSLYINGRACLTDLPTFTNRASRAYSIDNCTKYFRDGINNLDMREPINTYPRLNSVELLVLETEMTLPRC